MSVTEKLLSKVYANLIGTAAALVAQRLLNVAWKVATGNEPPKANDPNTPLVQASIWAAASTLGMGLARVLSARFAAARKRDELGVSPSSKPQKITVTV